MKKQLLIITTLLLSLTAFSQVPSYVPTNGLVGYWPFNGNANDESGNGNNGTVNGASLTSDRFGVANSAFYFSSSGCATRIDASVNTSTIQSGLTISMWVCKIGNGCIGPRLFEFWPGFDGPGIAQWGWDNSNQGISVGSQTSTGFVCYASIPVSPNDVWSHILYTNDGSSGRFYKDGILVTTIASNGNPILAGNVAFGRMNHPAYDAFNGNLDDMGIWNRALTACEVSDLFNAQLNIFSISAGQDQTICQGEEITLIGSGGANYTWDNGIQDGIAFVPTGNQTYIVTSTSNSGCVATDQVTVTVNSLPNVSAGADQMVCDEEQIILIGAGAANYSWDNGASDGVTFTEQGTLTYTVTGTDDNSCSNTDQVIVTVNPLPTIDGGADLEVCEGDTIILSASGAVSYVWNNNIINGEEFVPVSTDEYIVTGTDASGCIGIDSVNIYVNNTSASTLTQTSLDSYTLNSQTYTQSGTYTQVIPNAVGCDSIITLNLTLDFTGLQEFENSFTISPNPATDELTISTNTLLNESYILFDPQGRKVLSGTLTGTTTELDLSKLASGNYLLQIGEKQLPVRIVKN